jgi:uncharacterized membrane protein YfcA
MFEIVANIGLLALMQIWAVVIFASILRSFTGFGFALTAVPVFSLFLSPTDSVVLSAALTLSSNLLGVRTYWGIVPIKPLIPLISMAALGTAIGTLVLAYISVTQFRFWAGISVVFACAVLVFFKPTVYRVNQYWTGIAGLISGLMNGTLAIPGPPIIIYVMASEPVPERSRALLITFFLASAAIALFSFGIAGFIEIRSLWTFLLAFPAMVFGDKVGFYLFKRYGSQLYRQIAIASLLVIGVTITSNSLI